MMHDRDLEVAGLRAEGYSLRSIAKMQRMSLAGVQRELRRAEKVRLDLDDDVDALDPLRLDDDEPPVGSVHFVGVDEFDPRIELFADERGRKFDLLALYRRGRRDGLALFRSAVEQLQDAANAPGTG